MGFFNLIDGYQQDDGYFIFFLNKPESIPVKVYSEKSIRRESRHLNDTLKDLPGRKKLIWIAPFQREIFKEIEDKDRLVWISPLKYNEIEKIPPVILASEDKLQFFLNDVTPGDSFLVKIHPALFGCGFEKEAEIFLKNAAIRIKTVSHFRKIWKNNFIHNRNKWIQKDDIMNITRVMPDLFLLGGPGVDAQWEKIKNSKNIWAADTSLPLLAYLKIKPDLIFSVDAGYGSYEHFIPYLEKTRPNELSVVLDPLSFPELYKKSFLKIYSYTHSNPLLENTGNAYTCLVNKTGDVYGTMVSVFEKVFSSRLPGTIGHDGGHLSHVTHFRGSAYHRRQYVKCSRFITPETYFFGLSSRYDKL